MTDAIDNRKEQEVRRAFVVAHFDLDGALDEHVRATTASFAADAKRTILVSTKLNSQTNLSGTGIDEVIRRKNYGYDFRSWQVGLRALGDLTEYDEVVLLNDSFYLARENAIPSALATMKGRQCDVWSLTASREHQFHLQSYFLAFRPAALRSAWFRRFWNGVDADGDRAQVVKRHEIPLAAQALSAGLRVATLQRAPWLPNPAALVERWSSVARNADWRAATKALAEAVRCGVGLNPTLSHWRRTCVTCGIVKGELLRSNPDGADLSSLGIHMEAACYARAQRHLRRVQAGQHQEVWATHDGGGIGW